MRLRTNLLAAAVAFAALPAAAAQQIMTKDVPGSNGYVMTETKVTVAPGEVGKPHHHAGFLVAYMLKGTVISQVEGEPERTYHVGDSWIENPGAHHIGARNPSATEPAEFLVVFFAPKGTVLTTYDK